MLAMFILASIIAAFALFEVLALRYGAESRPASTSAPSVAHRRNI